jgi:phosphoglycolate phosphatase-like HAD superfamily hydrolase
MSSHGYPPAPGRKLVLFDMDQTLVDFIGVHDKAVAALFRRFFNVEARLTEIDYSGRSFQDSFSILARAKGVREPEFYSKLPELLESYDATFRSLVPGNGRGRILPGVLELLKALTAAGHLLMLYTGDSEGVVEAVFQATGLGKYFRACFYGTAVKTRAEMVGQAIEKGREIAGRDFKGKDLVIIGDSIRDIECGQQYGALTIAVATGRHTGEELREKKPDYCFRTLADTAAVMAAVTGAKS